MNRPLVINLGLPKSGTTTLATALAEAGYRVADHRLRRKDTSDRALWRQFVGDVMYRGYFGTGDPLAELREFDAIAECSYLTPRTSAWPQMDFGLIEAIRTHHPGAKFVATHRDPQAVARSMQGWTNMQVRLERGQIPGLPPGYGARDDERVRWIEAHYRHLARIFDGAPADFLMLDVAADTAQAQLSGFLGVDLPWWGRANANPTAGGDDPNAGTGAA